MMRTGTVLLGVALGLALIEGAEWSFAALVALTAGLILVIVAPAPLVARRTAEPVRLAGEPTPAEIEQGPERAPGRHSAGR